MAQIEKQGKCLNNRKAGKVPKCENDLQENDREFTTRPARRRAFERKKFIYFAALHGEFQFVEHHVNFECFFIKFVMQDKNIE